MQTSGEETKLSLEPEQNLLLQAIISQVNETYGKGSLILANSDNEVILDRISTGHIEIDKIFGGGVAIGRISEFHGAESSGKTTLALQVMAQAQKKGLQCAYIDVEHAIEPPYAKLCGVNWNKVLENQPMSAEEALDIMVALAKSGVVQLIVLDSVAALATKRMIEGTASEEHMAEVARLMSKEITKVNMHLKKNKVAIILINQLRDTLAKFGKATSTPGGRAIKFAASLRVELVRYENITATINGDTISVGQKNYVTTVKNKVGPAHRKISVELRYPTELADGTIQKPGFCNLSAVIAAALESGVMTKVKNTVTFPNGATAVGENKVREYLQANADVLATVEAALDI